MVADNLFQATQKYEEIGIKIKKENENARECDTCNTSTGIQGRESKRYSYK